jgi:hypothetical protein
VAVDQGVAGPPNQGAAGDSVQQAAGGPDAAQERQEYEEILDSVVTSVSETYYSQLVQAVSGARGRAQAAQSTVTLFAGGLMAALSVTALADRPAATRWMGIASVALWLLAALFYLRAVASPVPENEPWGRKVTSRQELLNRVITKVRAEAKAIDKRQRLANWTAAAAVALSVLTFAQTVLTDPVRETAEGAIVVDHSYAPSLAAACRVRGRAGQAGSRQESPCGREGLPRRCRGPVRRHRRRQGAPALLGAGPDRPATGPGRGPRRA